MDKIKALTSMSMLPRILAAAQLLHELGLQSEPPKETVKRFVLANPDINEALNARHLDKE